MVESEPLNQQQQVESSGVDGGRMFQQQNRYAHLVTSKQPTQATQTTATLTNFNVNKAQVSTSTTTTTAANVNNAATAPLCSQQQLNNNYATHSGNNNKGKAPPLGSGNQQQAYANYYYNSFSTVDWREQWIIMKEKILEKVEEPQSQRKLILVIVCCALLLDNMLYMVIVPIIPDYLRSIGAWSTYTENAKWIRRNTTSSGVPKWERVGGNVIYEGEDSAVGFLFASKAIVQLFINPFSGAIIDRIGYEIPMMIGLTVMFFSTMVFACGQTYSVLFLARSLQGVGSAFADTSGLAMIADRFTEENERQRALGVALAFISFGCLVAPPFGAVLYQGAGKEVPFIILSLVCLLDGSLLLLVTPPGTFAQLLPSYRPPASPRLTTTTTTTTISSTAAPTTSTINTTTNTVIPMAVSSTSTSGQEQQITATITNGEKKRAPQRQKSISRRQSMTVASAGETPKGTPIYVLFRDPYIACCSGALVVANVSLAFLEPTISIWMQNTMPEIEEWQMGMIWLPAFVPHVLGVYSTVKLADKYPRYQWLIAAIGLVLEGLSCLMVPFCTSFWSLIIPISIICFGLALIDTAILPTLGFLVDTRYVSVYGSIYAIADISYSLSYAIGPVIAGGIVEAIGFTALNFLIAIVTLGYTPILVMLRSIHDYEPFEADNTGLKKKKAQELAPFGRPPINSADNSEDELPDKDNEPSGQQRNAELCHSTTTTTTPPNKYESPKWATNSAAQQQQQIDQHCANIEGAGQQQRKPALVKKASIKSPGAASKWAGKDERPSVKIVEDSTSRQTIRHQPFERDTQNCYREPGQPEVEGSQAAKNPFLAD